ncbi:sterol carrier protein [Halocatena pleomorpha]|uniref:Sterol carrier protein n=1 Tax=Halocatena pleomorpha TaxID=1785090 RepID=A0A3P3RGH1_9EURY|nr:sterol carrier protein [Halocatena pleomorpha]RRJ32484.1 sterol carrier protein [Halocatena pleomorpha]
MTNWFPSREWLTAYRKRLNENETYEKQSEGWGVDFDGGFVFEITDLPVTETTIGDLPPELSAAFRERLESVSAARIEELIEAAPPELAERMSDVAADSPRERFITALLETEIEDAPAVTWPDLCTEMPDDLDDLLDQLERYVHKDTVYASIDLHDGECRATEVLETPPTEATGFVLTAPYGKWTELIEGADVIEAVMSQDMDLDGDITNVIIYPEAAQEMGDTAGRMETTFLF